MSYTIVGMFPTNEAADNASDKLDNAGFAKEDYQISRYTTTGNTEELEDYNFEEDQKTSGFWNWLFGENEDQKQRYSYAGTKSNLVTVYTDDLDRAEEAKEIMNNQGAVNVNDFTKDRYQTTENDLDAEERARIINKAKNNLYQIDSDRKYTFRIDGINDTMDSQGNTF